MNDGPLSCDEFETLVAPYANMVSRGVAVAVSGGPDSMALVWLLAKHYKTVALTVDHGLRSDSADEAQQVGQWLKDPGIEHHILSRNIDGLSGSRIQEEARYDRYRMMMEFCKARDIKVLCVAHHREDQAETFLFRLAKGSGLDGLSSMQAVQEMGDVRVLRPLLGVSKTRLIATCEANGIPYVCDPSNEDKKFARVRLRHSMDVLSEEGLTAKRLGMTVLRLSRARTALDYYASQFFESSKNKIDADRIVFDVGGFKALPEEISLRVLGMAYRHLLAEDYGYGPRMEKLESLLGRLLYDPAFNGATLGGCIIRHDPAKKVIVVELERKNATLN